MAAKKATLKMLPMQDLEVNEDLELLIVTERRLEAHSTLKYLEVPFSVPEDLVVFFVPDPLLLSKGIVATGYPVTKDNTTMLPTVLNTSERPCRLFKGDVLGKFVVTKSVPLVLIGTQIE